MIKKYNSHSEMYFLVKGAEFWGAIRCWLSRFRTSAFSSPGAGWELVLEAMKPAPELLGLVLGTRKPARGTGYGSRFSRLYKLLFFLSTSHRNPLKSLQIGRNLGWVDMLCHEYNIGEREAILSRLSVSHISKSKGQGKRFSQPHI